MEEEDEYVKSRCHRCGEPGSWYCSLCYDDDRWRPIKKENENENGDTQRSQDPTS